MSEHVKQHFNDIRKSIGDMRDYRGLKLKNDMTVLLVSDPETDNSAMSLSVAVGSLSEPKNLPGLAHLCEHMLFTGTKKYPGEDEFSSFITENGGYYCGYTTFDHANFYCSCMSESLEPVMDRFSRFFYEPLFSENVVLTEIDAVHAEHEKHIDDDRWRLAQLKRTLADPDHPFNMFGSGTKQTLWDIPTKNGINICNKLLEYHSKWFSSNLMYLAVVGKEDLDALEEMVSSLFIHIKNKNLIMPIWTNPIYKEDQFKCKTTVVPVNDIKELSIEFFLRDQQSYYKSMPIEYLNAVLGHTNPGGISDVLLKKGWSTGFLAGNVFEIRGIEFYEISVELTELGLDHVDDIIKLLFQYVKLLKLNGPQEWFYKDTKHVHAMEFQFKDKESPLPYVYTLTPLMIRYDLNDILTAENLLEEWKPEHITELLSCFRPSNMRVMVISKKFQSKTNEVEKYYNTRYSVSKIPDETLNFWLDDDIISEDLKMPTKNEFINSNVNPGPINIRRESEVPQIFYSSPIIRCWFKKDTHFKSSNKVYLAVEFYSPVIANDPLNCNVLDIFVRMFNEYYTSHVDDASKVILHSKLKTKMFGFNIKFHGLNHRMYHLVRRAIHELLDFTIDPERLEVIKEEKIRELKNMAAEQPYRCATRYSSLILSDLTWAPDELLKSMHRIEVNDIECLSNKFFSHLFMEVLIYGNLDHRTTLTIIHELEKPFLYQDGFRPLLPLEMVNSREVEMEDGENQLYEHSTDFHSSSSVLINLQCGVQNTKDNVIVSLLNQIIEEPCVNILRTQEKLGYVVMNLTNKFNGILYLGIIVQSDRSPMYVHTRIENFISNVKELLENLSDEEFVKHKETLSAKLLEKPKDVREQAIIYRAEISKQYFNFNRAKIEAEELKSITKSDIIHFYNEKISRTGAKRRKLAVHVKSSLNETFEEHKLSNPSSTDNSLFGANNVQRIKDISEFRKTHRLYPVPKPFIPIGHTSKKIRLYDQLVHVTFCDV